MRLCDRCRVSGCYLNYLGDLCKQAREEQCPDIIYSNADRIRDMTDEELLDFLKKLVSNAYMCKLLRTEPMFLTMEWIQQPAKED